MKVLKKNQKDLDSQASIWNGAKSVKELDILLEGLRSIVHCSNSFTT